MRRVPVRPGDDEDAVKKTFVRVLLLIAAVATLTLIFQVVCDAARVEASEVMLRWTNPSTQADTLDCTQAGTSPETMGSVWFDVVRIPQGDTLSLGSKNVAGKEGLPDSITVDIADSIRYVEFIVWTVDAAGNRSCLKNHLLEAILPDTTVTPPLLGCSVPTTRGSHSTPCSRPGSTRSSTSRGGTERRFRASEWTSSLFGGPDPLSSRPMASGRSTSPVMTVLASLWTAR